MERAARSARRTPYLVVRIDKQLIKDRNDIDDALTIAFVKQLIVISAQSPEQKELLRKSLGDMPLPK